MMEALTPVKRAVIAVRRLFAILASRARRIFGGVVELTLHDQLGDLSRQTQRLGSASVESVTYVGTELRALDERLSRIEKELATLREAIERSGSGEPAGRPDEVASGPHSG
jgi:hypothetical protein